MRMKTLNWKQIGIAFACGSLFFSGIAMAKQSNISVSFDKVRIFVNGADRTSADGQYGNQGQKVPESLQYKGTTYVPIRMVGELLGQSVYWAEATKSVWIGETYVPIMNGSGEVIGKALLSEAEGGVKIRMEAKGLAQGKHGFHLHEKLIENNDFKTAGGHYNPDTKKHGHDNPEGHHAGDFPNLVADADGAVNAEFVLEGLTLEKGADRSVWGKSFIIHATEDDYKTDPSGNSGDRIAGGNIR